MSNQTVTADAIADAIADATADATADAIALFKELPPVHDDDVLEHLKDLPHSPDDDALEMFKDLPHSPDDDFFNFIKKDNLNFMPNFTGCQECEHPRKQGHTCRLKRNRVKIRSSRRSLRCVGTITKMPH